MRVKIFSRPWENAVHYLETEVNEFLATLPHDSVKHINTCVAAAQDVNGDAKDETIITVWYQET